MTNRVIRLNVSATSNTLLGHVSANCARISDWLMLPRTTHRQDNRRARAGAHRSSKAEHNLGPDTETPAPNATTVDCRSTGRVAEQGSGGQHIVDDENTSDHCVNFGTPTPVPTNHFVPSFRRRTQRPRSGLPPGLPGPRCPRQRSRGGSHLPQRNNSFPP